MFGFFDGFGMTLSWKKRHVCCCCCCYVLCADSE